MPHLQERGWALQALSWALWALHCGLVDAGQQAQQPMQQGPPPLQAADVAVAL